jgi:DeoR/GlpR family transcriptional regulator of sugar metabolism
MQRAQRVVLLTDSGKVGQVAFAQAGRLTDIHLLITDQHVKPELARQLRRKRSGQVSHGLGRTHGHSHSHAAPGSVG